MTTHCLPTGSLAAGELAVPNVSLANASRVVATGGARRGICVLLHGMYGGQAVAPPVIQDVSGLLPSLVLSFANTIAADGWECLMFADAEDFYPTRMLDGVYNDVNQDPAHGARHIATTLHWWDHIVGFIRTTYAPAIPIVPFGISWGGWHAFQIAANKLSTILGYGIHIPVTLLSQIAASFTYPLDFSTINTTGADTTTTMLNAANKPGVIGWSTNDSIVGFTNTQAIFNAASGAGMPVTSHVSAEDHAFGSADVTFYSNWFTSTLDPLAPRAF